MADFITVEEDGYPYLEGRVLLVGDLVEIYLGESDWWIGQVERIGDQYQISLFDSDWGRLILSQGVKPIPAKRLAERPSFLPPFGEDWQRRPHPPNILLIKNSSGEIIEKVIEAENYEEDIHFPTVTAQAKTVMDKIANKLYFWDLQLVCPHCEEVHHYKYPEPWDPTPGEFLGYFEAHCDGPGYFVIIGEVLN